MDDLDADVEARSASETIRENVQIWRIGEP
jgi:hypothetical protein